MIGLRKENQYLKLYPGAGVPWEVENDLLDFDYIGQAYSWSFKIPREGNEAHFHFAGDPDSSTNGFRLYEGYELTKWGNPIWAVNIALIDSDDLSYDIEVTTVPGALILNKEVKLSELVQSTIAISNGTYEDAIGPFNTLSSNMVFPVLQFFNEDRQRLRFLENTNTFFGLIPCFKVIYLLREACETLGYTFVDGFSANDDFRHLILICNRLITCTVTEGESPELNTVDFTDIDNTIVVADYLPDWTLLEFMQQVAIWTGSSILVDDESKRIELRQISRQLDKTQAVDLRECIPRERIFSKKSDVNGYSFKFELPNDDLLGNVVTEREGVYLGEYTDAATLAAEAGVSLGDYGFCQLENAYYRFEQGTAGLILWEYTPPFQTFELGSENLKSITLKLLPPLKTRYTIRKRTGSFVLGDNGSGKVRITGWQQEDLVFGTQFAIYFEETTAELLYNKGWYQVTASGGLTEDGSYYEDLDLDYINPPGSETTISVKVLWGRREENYYMPVIGDLPYSLKNGSGNKDFKGRLAIWRAMQTTIDGLGTYPQAAVDPYDKDLVVIGTHALRIEQALGIQKQIYSDVFSFMRNTRIFRMPVHLPIDLLQQLYRNQVGRIGPGFFCLRNYSASINNAEIVQTEIEGYRL